MEEKEDELESSLKTLVENGQDFLNQIHRAFDLVPYSSQTIIKEVLEGKRWEGCWPQNPNSIIKWSFLLDIRKMVNNDWYYINDAFLSYGYGYKTYKISLSNAAHELTGFIPQPRPNCIYTPKIISELKEEVGHNTIVSFFMKAGYQIQDMKKDIMEIINAEIKKNHGEEILKLYSQAFGFWELHHTNSNTIDKLQKEIAEKETWIFSLARELKNIAENLDKSKSFVKSKFLAEQRKQLEEIVKKIRAKYPQGYPFWSITT